MYLQRNVTTAIQLLILELALEHIVHKKSRGGDMYFLYKIFIRPEHREAKIYRRGLLCTKSGKSRCSWRDSTRSLPLDLIPFFSRKSTWSECSEITTQGNYNACCYRREST